MFGNLVRILLHDGFVVPVWRHNERFSFVSEGVVPRNEPSGVKRTNFFPEWRIYMRDVR